MRDMTKTAGRAGPARHRTTGQRADRTSPALRAHALYARPVSSADGVASLLAAVLVASERTRGAAARGTHAPRSTSKSSTVPIWAAHAGQLAGVMIPYSWILR